MGHEVNGLKLHLDTSSMQTVRIQRLKWTFHSRCVFCTFSSNDQCGGGLGTRMLLMGSSSS